MWPPNIFRYSFGKLYGIRIYLDNGSGPFYDFPSSLPLEGHLGPQQEVGQDEVARLQEELGRETQGHAQRQHQLQDEVRLGDTPAARCWGGEGRQRHLAMW